jgi:hypothetical protein
LVCKILYKYFEAYKQIPSKTIVLNELNQSIKDKEDAIKAFYVGEFNTVYKYYLPGLESREYYLDRFNYLKEIVSCNLVAEFDIDSNIKGCTDKRRVCMEKFQNYIIWLDSDVYSTLNLLPCLIEATRHIQDDTYILTPEIVKFWDASWDQITNKQFLHEPYTFRDTFNVYSLDSKLEVNELILRKNNSSVKFAGGWFNLFTDSIFKKIQVPSEIGPYGPDDTYTMLCAQFLQIPQYILGGVVVADASHIYTRQQYRKRYTTPTITSHSRITDEELFKLVNNFYEENKFYNSLQE